ncbi:MAG: MFS transporter [Ruminococcus sp.]|nr:MFS transporter [Ruminococcus sp.]
MKQTKKRNMWLMLIVICLGGSIIYIFPYLQYTFYDSMMAELGFTNTQMGNVMSVYGALNLIAYFIGGMIADRFSSRILITFSLVVTGITGFWFATFPSYTAMMIISVIWSFTTIFTYWPATIKAVKLLGDSDVQGRLFGFREALNSFGALVFSSTVMFIFTRSGENFRNVVIFYSIVYIVTGIISFMFLPNDEAGEAEKRNIFAGLGYVLKNPLVWLIGFIIFFGYAVGSIMGRLTPYLTSVFKMGVATAGIVGIINSYGVGNVGAVAGGLITDKMKSSTRFLKWCFVIMAVLLAIFVAVPGVPSFLMAAIIMGLSVRLVQTAVRGVYFVPLDEAKIPAEYLGTAAGVVSVIGFAPDAFLFSVYGKIIDSMSEVAGYKVMFGSLIGFCAVGFVLTSILIRMFQKAEK